MADARDIPKVIAERLVEWRRLQRFWFLLHYSCGLGGVLAAVFASRFDWWVWGVTAAVSTALVTFLGPLQKGDCYKHAYYLLSSAVARFQAVQSVDAEWLLRKYHHAQQIVLSQDIKPAGEEGVAQKAV
jgi:hypothetical protein